MTILERVKKIGLNPLVVKYITVTVLDQPASYLGTQDGVEYWVNRSQKTIYKIAENRWGA